MLLKPLSTVLLAALLGSGLGLQAQTQPLKIGYVNSERILRESATAKEGLQRLEGEFGDREQKLADLDSKLRAASEKLNKEGATYSESKRDLKKRELLEQERDLQRFRREYSDDLTQRKNEVITGIVERTNKVLKKIFEAEQYDLILQDAVFAGPRVDITDKVIKALDATSH